MKNLWYPISFFLLWPIIVLGILIFTNTLDIEIFMVVWLNGFLASLILFEPYDVQPTYLRYTIYIVACIGIVVFVSIVTQRIWGIININT